MNLKHLLLFIGLLLFPFLGCKKDNTTPSKQKSIETQIPYTQDDYAWNPQEEKFFSLSNDISSETQDLNASQFIFHPRVLKSRHEIAQQNSEHHFVEGISGAVGLPAWKKSFVYDNGNENAVIIPLIQNEEEKINGLIMVHENDNGEFIFQSKTRQQIIFSDSISYVRQNVGLAKWMILYEHELFGTDPDSELTEAYCKLLADYDHLEPEAYDPCAGYFVYVCRETYTQTVWVGGIDPGDIQIYGPDIDDQDREDFQEDFQEWLDENYQDMDYDYGEDFGAYEDYWEDVMDFFEDAFDQFADFFEDVWDWFGDRWDDIGNFFDDGPDCPWDPIRGELGDRSVDCNFFYVYPCVHDPWWQFPFGTDDDAVLRFRLANLYETHSTLSCQIDFLDLEQMAINAGLDPWSWDFELNVLQYLDAARDDAIEGFLLDIEDSYRIPSYYSSPISEASICCNLSDEENFSSCVMDEFMGSLQNQAGALAQNLTPEEFKELALLVLEYESTYIDATDYDPDTNRDLIMLALQGDCLNSNDFHLCLADKAFRKDGETIDDPTIGNIDDLVQKLNECFETTSNTNSNYVHIITLYVDQPKSGKRDSWSGVSNVGHTFVGLYQSTPTDEVNEILFGFYPDGISTPLFSNAPGIIKNNGGHPTDVFVAFQIDGSEFNSVISAIQNNTTMWENYDLNTANCTDFGRWTCNQIGLNIPDGIGWWPKNVGASKPIIVQGQSPGALGEELRSWPVQPKEIFRHTETASAPESTCN